MQTLNFDDRRQKIQFRPPIEEIKSKYYREMKKFIGIPNAFKGAGGDASATDLIFVAIIDRNASGFLTCYQKAARLFKRLESVQDIFKAGRLDLHLFATVELTFSLKDDQLI
jgi:dynein heavy chain 2